ncbi:hypothetical protein [Streptomyces sp. NPDC058548]|uniref:hypothetical protein n=1 Tax=unclassified Streptomyces TaxID=2593676 RepID=UPI003648587C
MSCHFLFGSHPEHGFVGSGTEHVTGHLADWFLVREEFEPVPGPAGLYRLREPARDGIRRTRQAVRDLRRQGFEVRAEPALDPDVSPEPAEAGGAGNPSAGTVLALPGGPACHRPPSRVA